jgi:hypothetical protein
VKAEELPNYICVESDRTSIFFASINRVDVWSQNPPLPPGYIRGRAGLNEDFAFVPGLVAKPALTGYILGAIACMLL